MSGWQNKWSGLLCGSILAMAVNGAAGSALAQDEAGVVRGGASSDGVDVVDIVVTANKFGDEFDKVAVAVVNVGPEELEKNRILDVKGLASVSPGVVIHSPANFSTVNVRGIGTTFATAGLENSVATYVDGVYLQRQNGALVDLIDVASVQVLKGPQGTLYGRNATGGAVLINTADPTGRLEGMISGEYGRFDQYRVQGMINVPVSDTFAVRAVGQLRGQNGYFRNVQTGETRGEAHSRYFRIKALWDATPDLQIKYGFEYAHQNNETFQNKSLTGAPICTACAIVPGTVAPDDSTHGFYTTSASYGGYNNNRFTAHTLALEYTGDTFKAVSITGYRDQRTPMVNDLDFTYSPLFFGSIVEDGTTFTNDSYVRTTFDSPVNGLLGFSIMRERDDQVFSVFGDLLGPGVIGVNKNDVRINSVSAYGELTYRFGGGFAITGGVRYNRDKKMVDVESDPVFMAALMVPPDGASFSRSAVFESWTPRAVLSYTTGDHYFYASYNRGEKSGAFPSPLSDPRVDAARPEKLDNFEIGAKNSFLDGRLLTTFAAFYGKYKDIQATIADASKGIVSLANAASAKLKGVEFTADFTPVPAFNLSAGATYLHNRYGSFPNAPGFGNGPAPSSPACEVPPGGLGLSSCFFDISGSRLPNSPEFSGFARASYTADFANEWSARLSGNFRFTSGYDFVAGAGGPLRFDRQKGYSTLDLDLNVTLPNRTTEFGAYATNVFGSHYYDYIASGSFGVYGVVSMPTTYGLRVKQSF
ncbi:MAG: TonB-dependent receptor [Sphingobium sp.]